MYIRSFIIVTIIFNLSCILWSFLLGLQLAALFVYSVVGFLRSVRVDLSVVK